MRNFKEPKLTALLQRLRKQGDFLFLDSGAHSFFVSAGTRRSTSSKATKGKALDPKEYIDGYILWLEKYGQYFDVIAELDIAGVYGVTYADICDWRKRMEKIGLKNKLCVVSHWKQFVKELGSYAPEWERLCHEYPYMAIGDFPPEDVMDDHFRIWKRVGNNNRIHGFAMTVMSALTKYPYYSADSTSWQAGTRFGLISTYDEKTLSLSNFTIDRKTEAEVERSKDRFAKNVFPKMSARAQAIPIDEYFEYKNGKIRDMQNIDAYGQMQTKLSDVWTSR